MKSFTINKISAVLMMASVLFISSCQKEQLTEPGNNASQDQTGGIAARMTPRPFSDYLSTQGLTSFYVSPVPDFVGWGAPLGTRPDYYALLRWASIDYNGTSAAYLANNGGPVINTKVTGSVMEMPLQDGRALVTVNVHTENALTFAFTVTLADYLSDPLIFLHAPLDFGLRPNDLLANPSLIPSLSSSDLSVTFYNSAPGAPIPDMLTLIAGPGFIDVKTLSFKATSTGTFHALSGFAEGSQGTVSTDEKGVALVAFKKNNPVFIPKGTTNDAYPVETITYKLR